MMRRTGLDREAKPTGIPVTITNAFVLAAFTGCVGFAAPRLWDFFVGQTRDTAAREAEIPARVEARNQQFADMRHNMDKIEERVRSLENWARDNRLR